MLVFCVKVLPNGIIHNWVNKKSIWLLVRWLTLLILCLQGLATQASASLYPGCSTFHPAPCTWPVEAVRDVPQPWDSTPTCGRSRRSSRFLVSARSTPAVVAVCGVS